MDQEILKVFFYIPPLPASIPELKVRIRSATETINADMLQTLFTFLPMKMEQIECSETSACKIQSPGNHPVENIQHTEHGESLK
jgi:hypothetical protein